MAKARITKPSGASIVIEGSAQEVAELVERIEGHPAAPEARMSADPDRRIPRAKESLSGLLLTMIEGEFFKQPKDLSAVKARLDEMGHVYPVTTISPALLRRVRSRQLRRLKQNNRWFYAG